LRDERDRLLRENEALRTQSGALAHDAAELAYWAGPEPRFVPPGHFASPVPSLDEVRAQATRLFGPPPRRIAGIDLDEAGRRSSTSNAGSAKTSEANDVLFIDSSHVGKAGSDVNCLLFDILPSLRSGVHVHVHDVLHPFEYPLDWFEAGRRSTRPTSCARSCRSTRPFASCSSTRSSSTSTNTVRGAHAAVPA
jgi:hypothetical protein